MTCLSIDVGLLNLAICCMTTEKTEYNILFWELIDVIDSPTHKCKSIQKNGKVCFKNATFFCKQDYFCKMHFTGNKNDNKSKIKIVKIKDLLLQDIVSKLLLAINTLFERHSTIFDKVTNILIELQPKIANKMKLASHVIFGKLIDIINTNNLNISVRFIAAKNKLKYYQGPAQERTSNTYSNRKKASVQMITWYLENKIIDTNKHWKNLFESCLKKDDLSDACLYSIN
jgi:hypothetical protein